MRQAMSSTSDKVDFLAHKWKEIKACVRLSDEIELGEIFPINSMYLIFTYTWPHNFWICSFFQSQAISGLDLWVVFNHPLWIYLVQKANRRKISLLICRSLDIGRFNMIYLSFEYFTQLLLEVKDNRWSRTECWSPYALRAKISLIFTDLPHLFHLTASFCLLYFCTLAQKTPLTNLNPSWLLSLISFTKSNESVLGYTKDVPCIVKNFRNLSN